MTSRTHTPEDVKAIEGKYELNIWERALGWRKRQMIQRQLDPISNKIRNDALEEARIDLTDWASGIVTRAEHFLHVPLCQPLTGPALSGPA